MKKLFLHALNIILPPRCILCKKEIKEHPGVCSDCFKNIKFITEPICKSCGYPYEIDMELKKDFKCPNCISQKYKFDLARSAIVYNDFSKSLVLPFKHNDRTYFAGVFARWLKTSDKDIFKDIDYIIPIPIHKFRLIKRGYNQSSILAKYLSKLVKIPVLYNAVIRTKNTKYQGGMQLRARKENVKAAFKTKSKEIKGKNILLIDDVFTTGATVNECAKILKKSGAEKVHVLTLMRVIK
jgi:ComF family protein